MKINKSHEGKEFQSSFRFIGQVKKTETGMGENKKILPIFQTKQTKTGKPMRFLYFDVVTARNNNLKVEVSGLEKEFAYISSNADKNTIKLKWAERFDRAKYPNNTYHLMSTEWDLSESIGKEIAENDWVDVRGKYQFSKFVNNEGKEMLSVKRIITKLEKITDGQEINISKNKAINYICDHTSPDFIEVNNFKMEIGIKSVYQAEGDKDTIVNAVYLDWGKDKSTVNDVKLMVYYKQPKEGVTSLSDSFTRLNKGDFVKVVGVDNNRPIFGEVIDTEDDVDSDDIFGDIDDDEMVEDTSTAIVGNKRGLEITGIVKKTLIKNLLKEEELEDKDDIFVPISKEDGSDEDEDEDEDDLPF